MKKILIPAVLLSLSTLTGCPGNGGGTEVKTCADITCTAGQVCQQPDVTKDAMCVTDPATTEPEAPRTLGAVIDRMGRPGVNTALTNPFGLVPGMAGPMMEADGVTKDRYNKDGNIAGWVTNWAPNIGFNVAILDGLDGTCGNSLLYNFGGMGFYNTVAAVLADDELYIDVSQGICNEYLGVERKAVGATMANDCGGRSLQMDVIDITYSALAAGVLSGVDDGITNTSTFLPAFPFLGTAR